MKCFVLDYLGKYHFYEEDDFKEKVKDGEYILDNLKKSNRFDYCGATYTFTKFGNISQGITEKNVELEIDEESIDVKFNRESVHLDLIYKMDVKKLEDHYRIATRISEKQNNISVLLYVNIKDGEECLASLKKVRERQEKFYNKNQDIN